MNADKKSPPSDGKLRLALKVIVVLLTLLALGTLLLAKLWRASRRPSGFVFQLSFKENPITRAYPTVDFTKIYPGMSAGEIDQLQRACLGLRYVYAPFVEFRPLPVTNRFVTITDAGFRAGRGEQPWPPSKSDFVVFVFGGSTTFGYGLRDHETPPAALEQALAARWPGRKVQCYNFGAGYYFSTQERLLFEQLLQSGAVPDLAIFIEGLNDFRYADGRTELTAQLTRFIAPDLPPAPPMDLSTEANRAAAVQGIIRRHAGHVRLTQALAAAHGVKTIFVGQPVPFLSYPLREETYPFHARLIEHELCQWGYGRFEAAARAGEFGENFIWCGDAFTNATSVMYADSIHYSAPAAVTLAQTIVARAGERQLLPAVTR